MLPIEQFIVGIPVLDDPAIVLLLIVLLLIVAFVGVEKVKPVNVADVVTSVPE